MIWAGALLRAALGMKKIPGDQVGVAPTFFFAHSFSLDCIISIAMLDNDESMVSLIKMQNRENHLRLIYCKGKCRCLFVIKVTDTHQNGPKQSKTSEMEACLLPGFNTGQSLA